MNKKVKSVIQKTWMLKNYLFKLAIRILIFLIVFYFYITDKNYIVDFMYMHFFMQFTPMHVIWIIFMLMMIRHLFPSPLKSMAWKKMTEEQYNPLPITREELFYYVIDSNNKAWIVMIIWLCFNAIFGLLYLLNIVCEADIFMLTVFYFLADYLCILFFCPFQTFIMHNKCCVNCRIYDWGHFMMFTPMIIIQNFFCWSLFFMAVIVLIHWEITWNSYPERFYERSNENLKCRSCKDKTCQIKHSVSHAYQEYKKEKEIKNSI